ncbi:MAG: SEC-C domain-containing protein [Candidatus Nanopelagicales bacterium]
MPIDHLARPEDIQCSMPDVMRGDLELPHDELVARLQQVGLRLPPEARELDRLLITALDGGTSRWALTADRGALDLARSMDGRILTHRLGEWEAEHDRLIIDTDVLGNAWDHLHFSGLTLPSGDVVGMFDAPDLDWSDPLWMPLPAGTLEALGVGAGDLVGISYSDGVARLTHVAGVAGTDLGERLAAILRAEGPTLMDELFDQLAAEGDCWRTAIAPLSEIIATHGFHRDGDRLAASEQDLRIRRMSREVERVADLYELANEQAEAVIVGAEYARANQPPADTTNGADATSATDRFTESGTGLAQRFQEWADDRSVQLIDVRREATDPWVALVLSNEALDPRAPAPYGLIAMCKLLERQLRGSEGMSPATRLERAAMAYLTGRAHEHLGDPRAGEQAYHRCLASDPEHPGALLALAGIAADRGQYEAAASLLDRAGAHEAHPLRSAIATAAADRPPAGRAPGRNDPCWCGSGRKFKVCHARVSTSPLPARARPLLGRALAWSVATEPHRVLRLLEKAMLTSRGHAPFDEMALLAPDLVLFEGGGLADYLERREALIPADEAMLAQQWLLEPRSFFEVEDVEPGVRMQLRSLLTGDRLAVQEKTATAVLKQGHMVLTRVATVGDHGELFGGVCLIDLRERETLIDLLDSEPTAEEMIEFVAARYLPPKLTTSDGEGLAVFASEFRTDFPELLREELDVLFEPTGEDGWHLGETGEGQGVRVLGTLALSGDQLTVQALSQTRFDAVMEILATASVELVEVDHRVTLPDDLLGDAADEGAQDAPDGESEDVDLTGHATSGVLSPDEVAENPELVAALAEYIAKLERDWLDESIPALAGSTPREAAADPTRREDLIRLLGSLPATGSPLQMDGARLRSALGV